MTDETSADATVAASAVTPAESEAVERPAESGAVEKPADLSGENRRRHHRYSVDGRAQVCVPNGGLLISGRICDISNGGCFIGSHRIRMDPGTLVEVYFETKRSNFRVLGNITVLRAGVGVGITFIHPTFRIARQIRQLVSELEMDARTG